MPKPHCKHTTVKMCWWKLLGLNCDVTRRDGKWLGKNRFSLLLYNLIITTIVGTPIRRKIGKKKKSYFLTELEVKNILHSTFEGLTTKTQMKMLNGILEVEYHVTAPY
jgi:hypothetical protein